jgi:hypothetical protein
MLASALWRQVPAFPARLSFCLFAPEGCRAAFPGVQGIAKLELTII